MMNPADIYNPEQWHDFFVMVGGAAAALTGLVFIAMSLDLDVIARDATHRHRAIGTLSGFTAAFAVCALVLMGGQNYLAVGMEWLIVATLSGAIYVNGYIQAIKKGGSPSGLYPSRLIAGTSLYVVEILGAVLLMLGHAWGLYLAAVAMIILLGFTITGAWLLFTGVSQERKGQAESKK